MRITDTFVRHPVLALVVNLALILVGVRIAWTLPVQQYPSLDSASILINTIYTGANAETVRGFLTTPIENAVSSIGGVDHVESESRQGLSSITVHKPRRAFRPPRVAPACGGLLKSR